MAAVTAVALSAALATPTFACADVVRVQKVDLPVIATYVAAEEGDALSGHAAVDAAQGKDINFAVTGTLPLDVDQRASLEYWLVATPEQTLKLVPGSYAVSLTSRYTNGEVRTRDVTDQLTVRREGTSLVAGADDITDAIPGIAASDQLTLTYSVRLNFDDGVTPKTGFGTGFDDDGTGGNVSRAHVEYSGAAAGQGAAADTQAAGGATLRATRAAEPTVTHVLSDVDARVASPATLDVASSLAGGPASTQTRGNVEGGARFVASSPALRTASHTADARSGGLLQSPEIEATVYCFQIDVLAVDANDRLTTLGGASYALREATRTASGAWRWYMARRGWRASAEVPPYGATIERTGSGSAISTAATDADAAAGTDAPAAGTDAGSAADAPATDTGAATGGSASSTPGSATGGASATTARTVASFVALGADSYELVPVTTPTGYAPITTPIDLRISTNTTSVADALATSSATSVAPAAASPELKASSTRGRVAWADAETGVVTLQVAYSTPTPGSTGTPGSAGGTTGGRNNQASNGSNPGASGNGLTGAVSGGSSLRLPKTGDLALAAGAVLAISILALLAGLVLRRAQGRVNTQWSAPRTGRDAREEGMHHGGKQVR